MSKALPDVVQEYTRTKADIDTLRQRIHVLNSQARRNR